MTKKRRLGEYETIALIEETIALTEECSAILKDMIIPKVKDNRSFIVHVSIGGRLGETSL